MLDSIPFVSGRVKISRSLIFGGLIVTALLAFELFNYSTTDFALTDLLGDLKFMSIRWATILSIAFCGIDFAGIARLFTPDQKSNEPAEVWYLFGAWMLAALMNAMLTWWGVSIAILNHETLGNAVVARETMLTVVPIFVAVMVWLIRVLIIGTMSIAGDRFFDQDKVVKPSQRGQSTRRTSSESSTPKQQKTILPLSNARSSSARRGVSASSHRPSYKPEPQNTQARQGTPEPDYSPIEPTYNSVSMSATQDNNRIRH
jgi:hypothetical protein